jgi:hypothetical protein
MHNIYIIMHKYGLSINNRIEMETIHIILIVLLVQLIIRGITE